MPKLYAYSKIVYFFFFYFSRNQELLNLKCILYYLGSISHESSSEEWIGHEYHANDDGCVQGLTTDVVEVIDVVVMKDGTEETGVLELTSITAPFLTV